jgi:hypothetical protein
MKQFVGIKSRLDLSYSEFSGSNLSSEIKQQALMFDHLAITNEDYAYLSLFSTIGLSGELDWLLEQGIVQCYELIWPSILLQDHDYASLFSRLQNTPSLEESLANWDGKSGYMFDLGDIYVRSELETRLAAIELSKTKNLDVQPMIEFHYRHPESTDTRLSDVVEIVLEQFPTPDESTPWETIIEFRKDSEARAKFTALRDWMSGVARMQLDPGEIQVKLQTLLNEYDDHMAVHRIKTRQETLKSIVIAEAGFITSGWLAGLGPLPGIAGMIVTPIFSLRQRRIALLEAEQKAPGKQIAYIPKARTTFERQ